MIRAHLIAALHPHVTDELTWRWQYADGDMGLRSNYAPMIAMLECGGPTGGRPILDIDEHCLQAAERARHIDRALAALSQCDQGLLYAVLGSPAGDASVLLGLSQVARRIHARSGSQRPLGEWFGRLSASRHEISVFATRAILDDLEASAARASRRYAARRGFNPARSNPLTSL